MNYDGHEALRRDMAGLDVYKRQQHTYQDV